MMRGRTVCIAIGALISFGGALAQVDGARATSTDPSVTASRLVQRAQPSGAPASSAVAPVSKEADSEVIALREQIRVQSLYHSSLLDTVYWALGTVVTLAVLLVGAGWLTNFKFYENDKQRLKEEMETQIAQAKTLFDAQIVEVRAELQRTVEASLNTAADRAVKEQVAFRAELLATTQRVETALQGAADRANQQQLAIRAESQAMGNELGKRLTGLDELASTLGRSIQAVGKRIYGLESTVREVEVHAWQLKGVYTNVLITQGQGLRAAVLAEDPSAAKVLLAGMRKTIEEFFLKKDAPIGENVLKSAQNSLETASTLIPVEVSEVLDLLRKVKLIGS